MNNYSFFYCFLESTRRMVFFFWPKVFFLKTFHRFWKTSHALSPILDKNPLSSKVSSMKSVWFAAYFLYFFIHVFRKRCFVFFLKTFPAFWKTGLMKSGSSTEFSSLHIRLLLRQPSASHRSRLLRIPQMPFLLPGPRRR